MITHYPPGTKKARNLGEDPDGIGCLRYLKSPHSPHGLVFCTLEADHAGLHEAANSIGEVIVEWSEDVADVMTEKMQQWFYKAAEQWEETGGFDGWPA